MMIMIIMIMITSTMDMMMRRRGQFLINIHESKHQTERGSGDHIRLNVRIWCEAWENQSRKQSDKPNMWCWVLDQDTVVDMLVKVAGCANPFPIHSPVCLFSLAWFNCTIVSPLEKPWCFWGKQREIRFN